MDWQTQLIAEVVAGFAIYIAIGCCIGMYLRKLDKGGDK